ncbi:MAG: GNAT family N-acetyltransferase [Actinobacteria bacterium]|nr:GNAT family N-acetyltransferase [Actinomycetota bacterium]
MTPPGPHPRIPEGYRLRQASPADVEAVARVRRAAETALHGETDTTVEIVREVWALPRLDLARDVWLLEDALDELVGYGYCWVETPPTMLVAEQTVHPAHRGRGLSELLLLLGEARAAELARDAGAAGVLDVWANQCDAARLALFERRGFAHIRSFLRLDRELDDPVEPAVWPAGIDVRHFRRSQDEERVHAAGEEAFRDHFRPSTMDLDEWLDFRFVRDDLDLGLWFVAWDGEEVAGSVLAFETPVGGYVDELFVRRPWRSRGLGRALLLTVCAELRRRGQPLAYLGVDSENPTGAMRLYGSAGFVQRRPATRVYSRDLRPGRP